MLLEALQRLSALLIRLPYLRPGPLLAATPAPRPTLGRHVPASFRVPRGSLVLPRPQDPSVLSALPALPPLIPGPAPAVM